MYEKSKWILGLEIYHVKLYLFQIVPMWTYLSLHIFDVVHNLIATNVVLNCRSSTYCAILLWWNKWERSLVLSFPWLGTLMKFNSDKTYSTNDATQYKIISNKIYAEHKTCNNYLKCNLALKISETSTREIIVTSRRMNNNLTWNNIINCRAQSHIKRMHFNLKWMY